MVLVLIIDHKNNYNIYYVYNINMYFLFLWKSTIAYLS